MIIAEFYSWGQGIRVFHEELLNMYNDLLTTGHVPPIQTRGVIVCLPKKNKPQTVQDYRPLTLLNTDYKLYARILANRIKPTLNDVHATQYSAVTGRNILDATQHSGILSQLAHERIVVSALCRWILQRLLTMYPTSICKAYY